jgi:hypothetical protein
MNGVTLDYPGGACSKVFVECPDDSESTTATTKSESPIVINIWECERTQSKLFLKLRLRQVPSTKFIQISVLGDESPSATPSSATSLICTCASSSQAL